MKIIVAGYIIGYPLGGMTWGHLNYLLGLTQLGHEVVFYEDSGTWLVPYNPSSDSLDNDPSYGIAYLKQAFASANLNARWCYYSELLGQYFGMTRGQWLDVIDGADLLLCISGVTPWRDEFKKVRRTCVIDTDPVFTQLRMRHDQSFLDDYKRYDRVATFGKLIGTAQCPLPTFDLNWIGTCQPVSLPHWPVTPPTSEIFSTIGKWEHAAARGFDFQGKHYASSKGVEWMKLLELPARTKWTMEMAMASMPSATQQQFESNRWHFANPTLASISVEAYRDFIQAKAGEFTVAKQIYAGLPSGWFSDRAACFLASGRPAVTQSSGFEQWLPTGEGLFSFATIDEAADALERIRADYPRHARAARQIAERYFDARIVLQELLDRVWD